MCVRPAEMKRIFWDLSGDENKTKKRGLLGRVMRRVEVRQSQGKAKQ